VLGDRPGAVEAARRAAVLDPADDLNLEVLDEVTRAAGTPGT
jgi:hypothetical protein